MRVSICQFDLIYVNRGVIVVMRFCELGVCKIREMKNGQSEADETQPFAHCGSGDYSKDIQGRMQIVGIVATSTSVNRLVSD